MKHTIRFIIVLFSLVVAGTTSVWGITEDDIVINVLPNNSAGTVTVAVSGMDVTITATPATDYFIDRSHIIAEKMVDPLAAHHAPGVSSSLPISGNNPFTFTIPDGYSGAYVTVNFYKKAEGFTQITSLSEITNMNGKYQLTADVSGISSSLDEFTGTLDGGLHKIIGSSAPLFASTDGAIIRNIIFEDVNITSGDTDGDAGAVTSKAKGATRIYNCGILPTSVERDNKGNITGFYGSSVSGSRYVGGLVGLLDGTSRVINCYSYANVSGGSYVGGIVGYNNVATTATNLQTMVMNCMFYGEVSGTSIAPIYNGAIITNVGENTGVSNYNYFRLESSYIQNTAITKVYNCALGAETRFLQRFEFFRHVLNSHRELAAWWATGSMDNKDEMMKWVLEPAQISSSAPFPILKAPGYYPSVVNIDAENAPTTTERNKGGKLGKLSVTIQSGSGEVFSAPTGASITKSNLTLNITDKDPDHFNFNYYKVQLPYYNDVGTGNYTGNRVVTGWKIVSITGGTPGTFSTSTADAPSFNFADRNCTNKDLYSVSGRVFNQGAYWDVPEGVTGITIQPYWAKAAYVADAYPDVVYNTDMSTAYNAPNVGGGEKYKNNTNYNIAGEQQKVFTTISNAVTNTNGLNKPTGNTVHDYAVVLVGNVHQYTTNNIGSNYNYTVTTIDLDHDNEPDYSLMLRDDGRNKLHPAKWDFLNIVGLGMAQKSTGGTGSYNQGIFQPLYWFETTNTSLFRVTQLEYDNSSRIEAPLILQGGVMEQWVSGQSGGRSNNTTYFHVGGNVWFKEFHRGTHQDQTYDSKHPPVSVTGGDYDEFYLTGLYTANVDSYADNAECYINGGRFGVVAGAAMEGIGKADGADNTGNITWQVQNADIREFYAGGINAAKPVTGNLSTTITGGKIDLFCGGPKFGDMSTGKTVTTNATNCIFGTFFGAGYGGNSYSRQAPRNHNNMINFPHNDSQAGNDASWNAWLGRFYTQTYNSTYGGVSTQFSYQFLPMSQNKDNCGRIFVEYVKFSLATCRDVTSTLTGCKITGNFYGGGSLGKVDGPVASTLTNCEVQGSVFGAGFSASLPSVEVDATGFATEPYYYTDLGTYREGVKGPTTTYTWQKKTGNTWVDNTKHILYTPEDLTALGAVTGTATLTINGTTTVLESVYGGGEESGVGGDTEVTVTSGTIGTQGQGGVEYGNVYGGGKGKIGDKVAGYVKGNTTVNISQVSAEAPTTIYHNVYGGGAYGSVGDFTYDATTGMPNELNTDDTGKTNVTITGGTFGWNGKENGMVFGSSRGDVAVPEGTPAVDPNDRMAWVYSTHVTIGTSGSETGPTIKGSVYGSGENGHTFQNTQLDIHSGKIGITDTNVDGGAAYAYRGNVYGGGCGTDMYWIDANGNDVRDPGEEHYNAIAGIVRGNTTVTIDGGHVVHNVYGAGAMGSVGNAAEANSGKTTVTIKGKAQIGVEDISGNIYGAARGDQSVAEESFATVRTTQLEVSGNADIKGSVFGGGSLGLVKESTIIDVKGGSVHQSVYGGGSEANVKGNTTVTMTDGYIFNGIFGGGLSGSVGTFTRSTEPEVVNIFGHAPHAGCIGKPVSCADGTGKCTIVVSGGQIGPIEVATKGMNRLDAEGGPVPEGWVWGGGRGLVESPEDNPDVHFTAYVNETDVTIKDNAFVLESIIGGGEFGRVLGNTNVKIEGGQIGVGADQTEGDKPKRYDEDKFVDPSVTQITDDNALAPCSHYPYGKTVGTTTVYETYDPYADAYKQAHGGSLPTGLEGGSTDNASDGKTWIGCVFGGGSGYFPYKATDTSGNITGYGWVESAGWVEGNANLTISGGHILSNVYGANEYTTVQGKSTVTMSGGTIGVPRTQAQIAADPKIGHLFGGGKGDPRPYFKNKTNAGSVEVAVSGGIIYGSVFGGGESGTVKGGVTVTMTGGTVLNDVYGGGALADTQTNNWDETKNSGAGDWAEGKTSASNTTLVRLTGGGILGEAYGGGLGETGKPAFVWGDVLLDLNGTTTSGEEGAAIAVDKKGCTVNQVFGCNNAAGTPMGKVLVHVYATQNKTKADISTKPNKGTGTYDVMAVYGGGNLAAYEPAGGKTTTNSTNVIIDGCGLTSIKQVYGGGNAASTPATKVTVNGTYEVEELFGGGNGLDALPNGRPNPGANVGYKNYTIYEQVGDDWIAKDDPNYDTKEERTAGGSGITYGTGQASINVYGGTVHRVFGGSNTKGNVRQTAVTLLDENSGCEFCVDEAYGGGKSAPMDAEAKLLMACIPGLQAAYGGAEAAAIKGNVTLNITNGTFDRVFGGNNLSGTIDGSITVNVEEVGCKPIMIGELYGGGNQAGYSVYGYNADGTPKESGTKIYEDPQVNVKSFTSIGKVFGGGFGSGATMVGNPTVSVNEVYGRYYNQDVSVVGEDAKTREDGYSIPSHAKGKMGAISEVFGGGNAAKVIGNTTVNIANLPEVYIVKEVTAGAALPEGCYTRSGAGTTADPFVYTTVTGTASADVTYYEKKNVLGVDIRGNVYGGGNNAEVTGNTNVVIGKKNENQ